MNSDTEYFLIFHIILLFLFCWLFCCLSFAWVFVIFVVFIDCCFLVRFYSIACEYMFGVFLHFGRFHRVFCVEVFVNIFPNHRFVNFCLFIILFWFLVSLVSVLSLCCFFCHFRSHIFYTIILYLYCKNVYTLNTEQTVLHSSLNRRAHFCCLFIRDAFLSIFFLSSSQ